MEAEVRRTACKLGISQRQKMKKLTLDLAARKIKTHNVSNYFWMAIGKNNMSAQWSRMRRRWGYIPTHHLLKYFKYALPGFAQPFCQLYNSSFSRSHGEVGVNSLFYSVRKLKNSLATMLSWGGRRLLHFSDKQFYFFWTNYVKHKFTFKGFSKQLPGEA